MERIYFLKENTWFYKVSEAAGYNAARLVALVKAKYNCSPEYLTKAEYDYVYGSLNKK